MTDKITKDGVACIDLNYYWRPIEEAPHGVKLQYEEDTGEELELDVIALCCDFSEDTTANIAQSYDIEQGDYTSLEEAVAEYLQDQGAFLGGTTNGSIVYRNDF